MDISPYHHRPEILDETAQQIVKDFGLVGVRIEFFRNPQTSGELYSRILPVIERMQSEDPNKFFSLMYRIDISETQVRKTVEGSKDRSFSEVVTQMILERELQKVLTRKSFSQ